MTYKIFSSNINDLCTSLKLKDVIVIENNEEFESLNDDDLLWEYNNIKKLYKIELPGTIKEIYMGNNITFCWHYKKIMKYLPEEKLI